VACDGRCGGELLAEALRSGAGIVAFDLRVQLGGDFEELPVPGFPDLEKRAGVETSFDRASLVEALFEGLANEVFLQALAAGVLQNAGQPVQFLPVETVQRVLGEGHGALEI
jgi:hypothetical protein